MGSSNVHCQDLQSDFSFPLGCWCHECCQCAKGQFLLHLNMVSPIIEFLLCVPVLPVYPAANLHLADLEMVVIARKQVSQITFQEGIRARNEE